MLNFDLENGNKESTVFENHRKSLFKYCEQSELRSPFEWSKLIDNASFWKPKVCGQKVLTDRSYRTKLVKNANIEKIKCDVFGWFSNMFLVLFCKDDSESEIIPNRLDNLENF